MSKTTNTNMTGLTSPGSTFNRRISADSDQFDRNDVDAVGMALDDHDHDVDKGLGVARIQTGTAPSAAGNVRVNGDVFQWWANSAGSVYSAVSLAGTQTISGSKTFSSAINLTSGQIMFPAAQSASADANTLDDYEEGTWTPTIAGAITAGTQTYGTRTARYTKIGRLVNIEFNVAMTALDGTTAGGVLVTGLPFSSAIISGVTLSAIGNLNFDAGYSWVVAYVNGSNIEVGQSGDNVAHAAIQATGLNANTLIYGTASYSV
jgi:hypothetical protein